MSPSTTPRTTPDNRERDSKRSTKDQAHDNCDQTGKHSGGKDPRQAAGIMKSASRSARGDRELGLSQGSQSFVKVATIRFGLTHFGFLLQADALGLSQGASGVNSFAMPVIPLAMAPTEFDYRNLNERLPNGFAQSTIGQSPLGQFLK